MPRFRARIVAPNRFTLPSAPIWANIADCRLERPFAKLFVAFDDAEIDVEEAFSDGLPVENRTPVDYHLLVQTRRASRRGGLQHTRWSS